MKSREAASSAVKTESQADLESASYLFQDARWTLAQRVVTSEQLKNSTRLRQFLLYITECAIRGVPELATEQQIGVKVFQRTPGYNSSEDSIVRTHARLLRQKLAEYYTTEGIEEEIVIEVPKGHYLPVFHPRQTDVKSPSILASEEEQPFALPHPEHQREPNAAPRVRGLTLALAVSVLGVLVLAGVLARRIWFNQPAKSSVDVLWEPFLTGDPPLVIYSNAIFIGDSKTGLRYPPPGMKPNELSQEHSVDHYTGIGEVTAVYELTKLFDARRASFILKRSLLVTWDEAKLTNLVFIGSPAENPSLRVLPSTTDFTMAVGPDYAGFINHHPKAGEPEVFSRPENPLTKDYAILALLPGVEPGKQMLMLSGLTTLGTQAAVEYACRPESVEELFKAAGFSKGRIRPFEAVLEVTLGGGVPLQTRLVTIRVH